MVVVCKLDLKCYNILAVRKKPPVTIERLHFKDGIPLPLQPNVDGEIKRIIVENLDKAKTLPEGEYDLTPSWWRKHLHRHNLVVFEDGTGIYRAIPREKEVGTVDVSTGEFRKGSRMVKIPEDQAVVIVGGPLEDRKTLGIYEIIFHSPGPSPKK